MNQRPGLYKTAIPAGILLLAAAASMFLHHMVVPVMNDRVLYGIGAVLIILAIALFVQKRSAFFVVLFAILAVFSAVGMVAWLHAEPEGLETTLPLTYCVRIYSFIGMMIVCGRRLKETVPGKWGIAVWPYVGLTVYLIICGFADQLIWYLLIMNILLFVGLLLTGIAFRYAPESTAKTEPERTRPAPSRDAVKEPFFKEEKRIVKPEVKQEEDTSQPEMAEVEWLDE